MATTSLQLVEAPAAATWAEARKLVTQVRSGARAWLQLVEVLEKLRSEYFRAGQGIGGGGDRKSAAYKAGSLSPHDAAKVIGDERGWQAKVREELGISDDTARRWMLDARRYNQLLQITDGEVRQVDGQNVTPDVREKAKEALEVIQGDPTMRPARLWAGVWGANATKGKQRAAVDHARNIALGLTKLQTSLPFWADLSPDERAALEKGWQLIRDLLPETFK